MFDIGWSEILVVAIVALIVFPTKDLPKLMRTAGQMVGRVRRMASDFQSQMNTALREAEREIENEAGGKETFSSLNPLSDLRKTLDPLRAIGDDLKREVMTPAPKAKPVEPTAAAVAPSVATPAEAVRSEPPVEAESSVAADKSEPSS